MNRRAFLRRATGNTVAATVAIQSGALLAVVRGALGRLFRRRTEYEGWNLGLIDVTTSSSVHRISPETHREWSEVTRRIVYNGPRYG